MINFGKYVNSDCRFNTTAAIKFNELTLNIASMKKWHKYKGDTPKYKLTQFNYFLPTYNTVIMIDLPNVLPDYTHITLSLISVWFPTPLGESARRHLLSCHNDDESRRWDSSCLYLRILHNIVNIPASQLIYYRVARIV